MRMTTRVMLAAGVALCAGVAAAVFAVPARAGRSPTAKFERVTLRVEDGQPPARVTLSVSPPTRGRRPAAARDVQSLTLVAGSTASQAEAVLDLPIGCSVRTTWADDATPAAETLEVRSAVEPLTIVIPPRGTIEDPDAEPGKTATVILDVNEISYDAYGTIYRVEFQQMFGARKKYVFNHRFDEPNETLTVHLEPGRYRIWPFDEHTLRSLGEWRDVVYFEGEQRAYTWAHLLYASATFNLRFEDDPARNDPEIRRVVFHPVSGFGQRLIFNRSPGSFDPGYAWPQTVYPGTYRVDLFDDTLRVFRSVEFTVDRTTAPPPELVLAW